MKTKFRIIIDQDWYVPEYKGWFLWHVIYRLGLARHQFSSLKEAEQFVETYKDCKISHGRITVKEYN